jgi:hypothetical protein
MEIMNRTIAPRKSSIRVGLEAYVVAWNTCLKEAVKSMDLVTLLRNAHPAYRANYTRELLEAGLIHKGQANEFIKIVG